MNGDPISLSDALGLCWYSGFTDYLSNSAFALSMIPRDLGNMNAELWGNPLEFLSEAGPSLVGLGMSIPHVGFGAAADELVPASTPIGRLNNPIIVKPGTNAEAVISGRQFGGHALDQMQGRGVMPSAVENTVRVGHASP